MAPSTENKVKLVSMDGEAFEVETSVAVLSELVKTLVADDQEEGDEIQEIPLPNVKGHVLAKVVEFCRHHKDAPMTEIQKPLKSANLSECVDPWDAQFVGLEDQELLFELILAANYMDIKSLLDLSCAKVATMIKGKTPEEIRATFGITEEFTEEEQQRILEENKWIEDV
ncbi:E3 ubiquitin ligase complex SCF subunit sconC [Phytophthora citrophthora]|uniref:E3 ubiquitin ligase complex SCF subunit sconC n=1 Tax=Phytophthora citrophthora TaxID=4793 RepID=A0AAD9GRJ0_9STRA|nr:E3 ubiquitin ligase complex SCF subunit sconC [Phytophthora citrophthora]